MNMEPLHTSVTSAEFVRHFGMWQDRAATRPIFVTHHGRERLVVLSVPNFSQLSQRAYDADRGSIQPEALSLGSVLDRVAQGFIAVDRELVLKEINPAAASYLKMTRATALGKVITAQFPDLHRTLLYSHLVRAVQSGETAMFTQPSFTFDGRWLHFETMPYLNGAAVLFRDVTIEKAEHRAAEIDRATSVAMAAHGQIGRATISARGTLITIDPSLAAMAGFETEALSRSRFTDILPLARRIEAAHEIEAVLAGGEPTMFRSALLLQRGGEMPVRIAMSEMRGEHGNDGAVIVVTKD